jgi:D-alanyl-lipoteichoic acid acyltransferase DltB (MBOAT superfamily)
VLFNSYIFIFGFLPIVFAGHALLRTSQTVFWPIAWLVAASLVFYAWWRPEYLLLLLFSVAVNFGLGKLIIDGGLSRPRARAVLTVGIIFNLCLLGYFKYAGFFVANMDVFWCSVGGAEHHPADRYFVHHFPEDRISGGCLSRSGA